MDTLNLSTKNKLLLRAKKLRRYYLLKDDEPEWNLWLAQFHAASMSSWLQGTDQYQNYLKLSSGVFILYTSLFEFT